MKFSAVKELLMKGVQSIQSAINTKSTLPILSNILIEATEDNVVLTTTDLDIGIITSVPIKPSITGAITVPAKKFFDIIKESPEKETVSITTKKNNLMHIEYGKDSFKIMGLPKEEFPQLPQFNDKEYLTLQQKRLKTMLGLTSFAISHDETRYVLNGILFVVKPTCLRLVATDGRRLALAEDKAQFPKTLERKVIVPTKATNELYRMLGEEGEVRVYFSDNQIFFDTGNTKLISRLIEGDFPNYEQVIPKDAKDKIGVSRERLMSAVKRTALFTNPESMAIKIDIGRDKMILSKSSPYLGEARVEIDADYKGKEIAIGFNPEYLIDVLKNIEGEAVNLEVMDSEKPGVIRIGTEYIYVVLPMQLS